MKIKIEKINEKEFKFIEEGGEEIILNEKSIIVDKRTMKNYLRLPENSLKIQSFNMNKFEKSNIIEFENQRSEKSNSGKSLKKSLEEYMTEEERKIIQEIREKAEKRREEEKKRLEEEKKNPIEKQKRKINSIIENLKKLGMSEEKILELISKK